MENKQPLNRCSIRLKVGANLIIEVLGGGLVMTPEAIIVEPSHGDYDKKPKRANHRL